FGSCAGASPGRYRRINRERSARCPPAPGRANPGGENRRREDTKGRRQMNGLINPILVNTGRDAVFLLVWSCQATVLLALVWLLTKVRPAKTPTLRHRIWLLAITFVAVFPLLTTLIQRF